MHPSAARLKERLHARGLDVEVVTVDGSARTAAEAAQAVGCEVGQIVKSLVFVRDQTPVMVLCAGDRRVDAKRLVFEVNTQALIGAIGDATVVEVG